MMEFDNNYISPQIEILDIEVELPILVGAESLGNTNDDLLWED